MISNAKNDIMYNNLTIWWYYISSWFWSTVPCFNSYSDMIRIAMDLRPHVTSASQSWYRLMNMIHEQYCCFSCCCKKLPQLSHKVIISSVRVVLNAAVSPGFKNIFKYVFCKIAHLHLFVLVG